MTYERDDDIWMDEMNETRVATGAIWSARWQCGSNDVMTSGESETE